MALGSQERLELYYLLRTVVLVAGLILLGLVAVALIDPSGGERPAPGEKTYGTPFSGPEQQPVLCDRYNELTEPQQHKLKQVIRANRHSITLLIGGDAVVQSENRGVVIDTSNCVFYFEDGIIPNVKLTEKTAPSCAISSVSTDNPVPQVVTYYNCHLRYPPNPAVLPQQPHGSKPIINDQPF